MKYGYSPMTYAPSRISMFGAMRAAYPLPTARCARCATAQNCLLARLGRRQPGPGVAAVLSAGRVRHITRGRSRVPSHWQHGGAKSWCRCGGGRGVGCACARTCVCMGGASVCLIGARAAKWSRGCGACGRIAGAPCVQRYNEIQLIVRNCRTHRYDTPL